MILTQYQMHKEILEQPDAMRNTFQREQENMDRIASKVAQMDNIFLVGCGSSLSTCYSVKSALEMVHEINLEVLTGYEFYYHKKISKQPSVVILSSQSGETADTLAALRKANDKDLLTVVITNEAESSMAQEADEVIITQGGRETAIIATKTYVTQMQILYYLLFRSQKTAETQQVVDDLYKLPDIMEKVIATSEEANKKLAFQYKDDDIFYCVGSGPNYGLAYKLAMTMFMEGSLKHACPLYSGEFRHGLIERVEQGVPVLSLDANFPGDELTQKTCKFCANIGAENLIFQLEDYAQINPLLSPFILVIPLEWFIYYLAHYTGEDPGSTRHIGKVRFE